MPTGSYAVPGGNGAGRNVQLYRETLPNGVSYDTIDLGYDWRTDDYAETVIPAGHVFVMGDNRDNSMDSRFPAAPGGGVGLVDADLLVGRLTGGLGHTNVMLSTLMGGISASNLADAATAPPRPPVAFP